MSRFAQTNIQEHSVILPILYSLGLIAVIWKLMEWSYCTLKRRWVPKKKKKSKKKKYIDINSDDSDDSDEPDDSE